MYLRLTASGKLKYTQHSHAIRPTATWGSDSYWQLANVWNVLFKFRCRRPKDVKHLVLISV